jgi:hypothetical protein
MWKILLKQLEVSHEMQHTIPEGCTLQTSFVHVLGVWFVQAAVLRDKVVLART